LPPGSVGWAAAPEPTLVRLRLEQHGATVVNGGDFVIHVMLVEALPPAADAWSYTYPRARRVSSDKTTTITLDGMPMRVDRAYRVRLRDDHRARWMLGFPAERELGDFQGSPVGTVKREWPRPMTWVVMQLALSRRLTLGR
jgi:hypothetical protein